MFSEMNTAKVLILLALSTTSVLSNSKEEFIQKAEANQVTFQTSSDFRSNNVSYNDPVSLNVGNYSSEINDEPEEHGYRKTLKKLYHIIKKALSRKPTSKDPNHNQFTSSITFDKSQTSEDDGLNKGNIANNKEVQYQSQLIKIPSKNVKNNIQDVESIRDNVDESLLSKVDPKNIESNANLKLDTDQPEEIKILSSNLNIKNTTLNITSKEQEKPVESQPIKADENTILNVTQNKQVPIEPEVLKIPSKNSTTANDENSTVNIITKGQNKVIEFQQSNVNKNNILNNTQEEQVQAPSEVQSEEAKIKSKPTKIDSINKSNTANKDKGKQAQIKQLPNTTKKEKSKNVKSTNVNSGVNIEQTEKEILKTLSNEDTVSNEKDIENKDQDQSNIISKSLKIKNATNTTVKNITFIPNEKQIINNKKLSEKSIIKPNPNTIDIGKKDKPIPVDTASLVEKIKKLNSSNKYVIIHPNGELEATNTTENYVNVEQNEPINDGESAKKAIADAKK